jgi:cell division protein FtsI/penicillin-binding protein 2
MVGVILMSSLFIKKSEIEDRNFYDKEILETCEKLMQGKEGTIVVMDPQSGRIFALFNEEYAEESFPSGLTFVLITSFASLEEGIVDFEETINCEGGLERLKLKCGAKHGNLTILDAITKLCLIHFCILAERLGFERLKNYAEAFGLASNQFARKTTIGIGEGIFATPIQLLRVVSAIANNGILYKPKKMESDVFSPEISSTLPYSPPLYINLREALGDFIKLRGGEGIGGLCCPIPDGSGSWFIGFAPLLNPQYSIVVMLKDANEEESLAIGQKILKVCLKDRYVSVF